MSATVSNPTYHEGPVFESNDLVQRRRYFTYDTEAGLVSGTTVQVTFSIDRPPKDVWPYLKDFNLWQNAYGHYYSDVVGDLYSSAELDLGRTPFHISEKPNGPPVSRYQVLRVIPEQAIVIFQPIPEDGGNGGVSRGFHMFMLSENQGKTVVNILMEHATRTSGKTVEEALAYWRDEKMAPEWQRKWRDHFVPTLKKLVSEGK